MSRFLSFVRARAAVRKLKLKNQKEWQEWSKSGKRSLNIPTNPHQTYRDAGWISMPDWLGYEESNRGQFANGSFLPFERARAAVRKLKLKSNKEWREWSKSGKRPLNIPSHPHQTYRDAGWISMPDWLGYGRRDGRYVPFLLFERARAAVRKLKLKNQKEWREWSKSGKRPLNIPAAPQRTYRDAGWISYPDWLGYEWRPGQHCIVTFLPFERARAAVRKLKLKRAKEWSEWSKSGKRPLNIPGNPHQTYRDAGWISMPDWLGYEEGNRGQSANGSFLPFERARAAVRKFKLKSKKQWVEWSKSGKRPLNISGNPFETYRYAGWISWPDWLGYERRVGQHANPVTFLAFESARAAVRKLKLKSYKEWQEWSKSGKRPHNIPGHPYKVYRDAGWISYPDWLGYEARRKAPTKLAAGRRRGKKRKRASDDLRPAQQRLATDSAVDTYTRHEDQDQDGFLIRAYI